MIYRASDNGPFSPDGSAPPGVAQGQVATRVRRRGMWTIGAAVIAPFVVVAGAPPAEAFDAQQVLDRAKAAAAGLGAGAGELADGAKDLARETKQRADAAKKQVQRGVEIVRTVRQVTKAPAPAPAPAGASSPVVGGLSVDSAVPVVPTGTYSVSESVVTFVDTTRPTERTEKSAGSPRRSLETLVLAPVDAPAGQRFPLVVFGHGLGAKPGDYVDMLRPLAAAGFVVAAPRFPVGSQSAKSFVQYLDRMETAAAQPGDLTFVITQLLGFAAQPGPLQGRIDPARIGAVGHSLGATTVLDLTANECCIDARVKAVIPMSGFLNPLSRGAYFTRPGVPMMLVHGDKDKTVPIVVGSALVFAAAAQPRALLTVVGGDHVFRLGGRAESRQLVGALTVSAMIDFLDQHLKGAPDGLTRLRALVASQPAVLRFQE